MRLVDVSNIQGTIDWHKVRASGIQGAYIKATEGATYTDAYFTRNRHEAKSAGIKVGAYHFARPDHNKPEAEATNFLKTITGILPGELLPALDLEVTGHKGHPDPVAWARDFNHHIHDALDLWPLFYSYSSFINDLDAHIPIGAGLWLADYGNNNGSRHPVSPPAPWKKIRIHQYTSAGKVPGITGRVDLNWVETFPAAN